MINHLQNEVRNCRRDKLYIYYFLFYLENKMRNLRKNNNNKKKKPQLQREQIIKIYIIISWLFETNR